MFNIDMRQYNLEFKLKVLANYDKSVYGVKESNVSRTAEVFDIPVRTVYYWLAQRKKVQLVKQRFWYKIEKKHVRFILDRLLVDETANIRLLVDEIKNLKINLRKLTNDLNKEFKTNFQVVSVKSIISHIVWSKNKVLSYFGINCDEKTFQGNFLHLIVNKCRDYHNKSVMEK